MKTQGKKGFIIDDWLVSPQEGLLIRGDETVRLEPKAMEVLAYFASRPNEVITREELERDVWRGALVGYDAVTNTVIKLRKALQDNARQPRYIATIPKKGYQLIVSISDKKEVEGSVPEAPDTVELTTSRAAQPSLFENKTGLAIAGLFLIVVLPIVWLWSSTPPLVNSTKKPESTNTHSNLEELPSVAVLPFENLSDDPKQEYLAEGITDDIITDLSRLSSLMVIASNTSSTFKGQQVEPEKIGVDLNVKYILKGSIRRMGDALRVNAQLINTFTGFNVWAERYDRKVAEVFSVQDEVTSSIVNALAVKVTSQETNLIKQRSTDNLRAYDLFQEAQRLFSIRTKESHEQAREIYQKAIELDPNYGRAYGAQAVTLTIDYLNEWTDDPIASLDRALVLAQKAVSLDDFTPQTYWALGFVYLMRKEYENAEKAATQAINIAPNYADGYGLLALIKMFTAQPEQAIKLNKKGMQLNPYYTWQYLYTLGGAYYLKGDYEEAINTLNEAKIRNDNAVQVKLFLAASYIRAGQKEDAEWLVNELQVFLPSISITSIEKTIQFENSEIKTAFLDDLRKAGMPE